MKYMLLMYMSEAEAPNYTPEELQTISQGWHALTNELKAAGVLVSNSGLSSVNDATSVRVRNGKTMTVDGPFAETHEQLGGYYLLECQDLDEAISWAAKIPSAQYGTIEIRPVWSQK